jgi:hypothetical protein
LKGLRLYHHYDKYRYISCIFCAYTVTNAVSIPAGTKIRLEFANINNPVNPSSSLKVTVTTRNAKYAVIDGPTQSTAYSIK